MNDQPIFILGAHKSGTTLLRNMLSGHPDLFIVPFESHMFELMGYWIDYEYRNQRPEKQTAAGIKAKMIAFIEMNNKAVDNMGDTFVKNKLDVEHFNKSIEQLSQSSTEAETIQAYFNAIYAAIHSKEAQGLRVVEKSVEHAEFATDITRIFPKAKFIHIVRNPYANFVSLRKYKSVDFGYPLMHRMIATLNNSYYHLYRNQRNITDYYVLKYEDLLEQTEQTIQAVCEHLDISFNEGILTPTHLGEVWQGNSSTGKKFKGVDASGLDKWKKEISVTECYFVNRCFDFVVHDFGYEKFEKAGRYWKKHKGEGFKRFMANRLYKYYLTNEWE